MKDMVNFGRLKLCLFVVLKNKILLLIRVICVFGIIGFSKFIL